MEVVPHLLSTISVLVKIYFKNLHPTKIFAYKYFTCHKGIRPALNFLGKVEPQTVTFDAQDKVICNLNENASFSYILMGIVVYCNWASSRFFQLYVLLFGFPFLYCHLDVP